MAKKVNYFPVQLRHDGVARRTLYRIRLKYNTAGTTCRWCGNTEYTTGHTTEPRLWRYVWKRDDDNSPIGVATSEPAFCCLQCWKNYYGD